MKTLIQDNGSVLIISNNGKLDTVPNTIYNRLKIGIFQGNQISHVFNKEITINETFDDGIFNCVTSDGSVDLQSRQSEKIAQAIFDHEKDGNIEPIQAILLSELKQAYQEKAIDEFLQPYVSTGRIVKETKSYVVDDRMMIDEHAKVFQRDFKDVNKWKGMCIVVKNTLIPFDITTPVGSFTIESKEIEILSKILFMLKPNMNDSVFTEQLSPDLNEQLMRDFPPPPNPCERSTHVIDHALMEFVRCEGKLDTKHPNTLIKICSHCSFPSKDDEKEHYLLLRVLNKKPEEGTLEVFQNDDTAEAD